VEPESQLAPPVVAVMVVFNPGEWFDEALDALAEQDYANLKTLFLVVGEPGDVPDRVRQRVPNAFVRSGNTTVMAPRTKCSAWSKARTGSSLLHDAAHPSAIRLLVEEIYRSNGIVGPKLVAWGDPGVCSTSVSVDRFGEIDSFVEGEVDQEQHDAGRCVRSARRIMIRATCSEQSPVSTRRSTSTDDVDLCWRAPRRRQGRRCAPLRVPGMRCSKNGVRSPPGVVRPGINALHRHAHGRPTTAA
jgi:hypothetical protein